MFYESVLKTLNEKKVRYLVAGGLAVNLHGVPRMTQDLDLFADLTRANIELLLGALDDLGYAPRPPVPLMNFADEQKRADMITSKNMKAFPLVHKTNPGQEIDILAVAPISFEQAYGNRSVRSTRSMDIPIMGIDDLILMKKNSGRKHDMSDAAMLEKIKRLIEDNS